ncbi:MAG: dihydrodipicolinate synthase family protein [Candidatus Rokubacteria bacterium]|nr:dihydrodipicolinate synthase family protein [Candidatus Rokubacteria bacterium]
MREFEGVFIPVPTPFRGEDAATERLKANLERWNQTDLAGYVVLGSTGEFPLLTEAERDRVLVAAREAIPKEKAFIAGTGAESTQVTIQRSRRAAEIGADAVIVITPNYYKRALTQPQSQIRHYLAVAEASPLPVLLYNFPQNTGVNLEAETVARIAEHPNVCGIKDSSANIAQAGQIIHQTPKSFHVLVGAAAALLPSLALGSSGGILALANIAAREYCEVYALARQGRWDEAREIVYRLMVADRVVHARHGIGGLKAALDLQGFYGGLCRAPLSTPDGDAIEEIKEVLAAAGLL